MKWDAWITAKGEDVIDSGMPMQEGLVVGRDWNAHCLYSCEAMGKVNGMALEDANHPHQSHARMQQPTPSSDHIPSAKY